MRAAFLASCTSDGEQLGSSVAADKENALRFFSCTRIYSPFSGCSGFPPFLSAQGEDKIDLKGKEGDPILFGARPSAIERREPASLLKTQIPQGASKFIPTLVFGNSKTMTM